MNSLAGVYGYVSSEKDVVSCTDPNYNWLDAGWWRTYLWCIEETPKTVILKSPDGDFTIEALKNNFDILGKPLHHIGDSVVVKKNGKRATVRRVSWHMKRQCFYYHLDYADRKSTNWFFDEDIEGA